MKRLSRRAFLATSTGLAGTLALAGLPAFAVTPKESTSLQAQVDAGELPPINERLPENPLVITPDRPAGPAGRRLEPCAGRRRLAVDGRALPGLRAAGALHARLVGRRAQRRRVLRGQRGRHGLHLQAAQGHEVVGRRALHHRGHPLLVRGHLHSTRTSRSRPGRPTGPPAARRASSRSSTSRPSASPSPRRTASSCRASPGRNQDQTVRAPAHYLKQFHNKYNPDVDALAKERGFESWIALFHARGRRRRGQRLLPELRPPDDQRLEVRDRARRGHRAGAGGAQPLLLEGRHRGDAAPLLRPRRLPDGRRSAGPALEDACRARST